MNDWLGQGHKKKPAKIASTKTMQAKVRISVITMITSYWRARQYGHVEIAYQGLVRSRKSPTHLFDLKFPGETAFYL